MMRITDYGGKKEAEILGGSAWDAEDNLWIILEYDGHHYEICFKHSWWRWYPEVWWGKKKSLNWEKCDNPPQEIIEKAKSELKKMISLRKLEQKIERKKARYGDWD